MRCRRRLGEALTLLLLAVVAGGYDQGGPAATVAPAEQWLIGSAYFGGADGEAPERSYLLFDAEAERLTVRKVGRGPVDDPTPDDWQTRLLVSGDHAWALASSRPFEGEPPGIGLVELATGRKHRLRVDGITPQRWFFDPSRPATLRVAAAGRIYAVSLSPTGSPGKPTAEPGRLLNAQMRAFPKGAKQITLDDGFALAARAIKDAGVKAGGEDPWGEGTRLADGTVWVFAYTLDRRLLILRRAPDADKFELVLSRKTDYLEPRFALPPSP